MIPKVRTPADAIEIAKMRHSIPCICRTGEVLQIDRFDVWVNGGIVKTWDNDLDRSAIFPFRYCPFCGKSL